MASCLLRVIAIFYLAITGSQATLIHPIGGAMAAATAGKVFFKGAIIAAAGAIAAGAFHKALEDFWKQQLGHNTQMPKAVRNCMNGNVNMQGSLKVDVHSLLRFENYVHARNASVTININVTHNIEFHSNEGGLVSSLGAPSRAAQSATVASIKDSVASLFFVDGDLSLGKKMNIHFTKSTNTAPFLPRDLVDKIPFNLQNFNEILNRFNLTANSIEAKVMKETLKYCEDGIPGDKCCDSLESMVEFAKAIVGKPAMAISSNVDKDLKMEYTVKGVKKLPHDAHAVICDKIPFPSAMFYCQTVEKMTVYIANLVGSDGSSINAPAVCHDDTSSWDKTHWIFKFLHAQPGKVPVCHFLLDDDVLWIAR